MSSSPALHDPQVWSDLVDAVRPAQILVAIGWRMGDLRQRLTPEDIWQEALLRAWQSHREFEWRGAPSFRRWLVRIAERCIENERVRQHAQKRDASRTLVIGATVGDEAGRHSADTGVRGAGVEPWSSTTPSRIVSEREHARAMEQALEWLPGDLREVVRLRLFEDLQILEIAERLALGESGVRHRLRKGVEQFHARLRTLLGSSSTPGAGDASTRAAGTGTSTGSSSGAGMTSGIGPAAAAGGFG